VTRHLHPIVAGFGLNFVMAKMTYFRVPWWWRARRTQAHAASRRRGTPGVAADVICGTDGLSADVQLTFSKDTANKDTAISDQ
jgi:hypothetical protein